MSSNALDLTAEIAGGLEDTAEERELVNLLLAVEIWEAKQGISPGG